jgi:hypothetical protein
MELHWRTSRVDASRRHDAAENICITWVKALKLATGADIIYMPPERLVSLSRAVLRASAYFCC